MKETMSNGRINKDKKVWRENPAWVSQIISQTATYFVSYQKQPHSLIFPIAVLQIHLTVLEL
jgi:hypothetical protein